MGGPVTRGFVDLIRHGEPVGGRRYRGQLDDPLSELGWSQMWHAVGENRPWQRVVTSPLARCRAFAEALAETDGVPLHVEPRFMEVGFGVWEGRSRDELEAELGADLSRFYTEPVANRPEGAEPLADFAARVMAAWEEWTAGLGDERLLVVAHAGVIRAVLGGVLGIPHQNYYRLNVDNAGLTRIQFCDDRPPVVLFHGGSRGGHAVED